MTAYEHLQGQVGRRPTVTRHSRLQRHRTSPLGSGYAEEFELACRAATGVIRAGIAARSHPRFGGAMGLTVSTATDPVIICRRQPDRGLREPRQAAAS
jgi:hypothetical protein